MNLPSVPHSVQIRLHAYPQLLVDGHSVPLQLKRAWALVACLSDDERKMSRVHAAHLLWPDAPTGIGRTRLRRLVHQINSVAGLELVTGDADAIWLATQSIPLAVDLAETRRAALSVLDTANTLSDTQSPVQHAAPNDTERLLQPASHTILAHFAIDSEAFDEWLAARRQEHERLLGRALQRMAEHQLQLDRPDAALASAQRLLDIDTFADAGHALVIEALGRLGQGAAVEAAYDRCASLMRHEFGTRPSATVEAAYAAACQTLRGVAAVPPTPATPAKPAAATPALRYAVTRRGAVAYTSLGTAGPTLLLVPEVWSHIETSLDEPHLRRVLDRLAATLRVVMLDRRGADLAERIDLPHTPEATVEDLLAVMDALGTRQAWLLGSSTCGAAGIELAALHPQRVLGLILVGVQARGAWASDCPWGPDTAALENWIERLRSGWGGPAGLAEFAPSVADDPGVQAWWTRTLQRSTTAHGIAAQLRSVHATDVRHRLPGLQTPTLVLQREGDAIVRPGAARYLASHIPGAELQLLEGADHFFWHGDSNAVLSAIEAFIGKHRSLVQTRPAPLRTDSAARTPALKQQIRFARSHDGVRLAYASSGHGPPLIKAATWLSHLEFDWVSPVWSHVLRELSQDFTYVRYDERGCGLSDWDADDLSFESWIRDLDTVVEALHVERFALLGISQGASIAIAYAVRHPERVTHLVLHGGYARGRLVRSNTPEQREEAETMAKLAELGWGKADQSFRQFFTSQFIPGGTPEQHQWFNELERISTSPRNAARFMRGFADIDVVDLLPHVRCPTLVLHSHDDVRVPSEESRLIATAIPGARFVPIASGNHLLLEHEPGWLHWIDEVREFLAAPPSPQG